MNSRSTCLDAFSLASLLLAFSVPGFVAAGEGRALTPAELESDWLRQLELRYPREAVEGDEVTPAEDAAGAVDGQITGQWGFHTLNEPQPWWQVDLQQSVPLDRLVIFNRGSGFQGRASRIQVLVSEDGERFRQVYQHDGTVFGGQWDNRPLRVPLHGIAARHLRLSLPGTTYFHLDEVQVFAEDREQNLAIGKPATQSSVSPWSTRQGAQRGKPRLAAEDVIEQGLQLAGDLQRSGVPVDQSQQRLVALSQRLAETAGVSGAADATSIYLQAQRIVRELSFKNPLLDFDTILFSKRAPGMFPHVSDQYYGWWSRSGGGIYLLRKFRSPQATVTCLTEVWPPGSFLRPELSYDGQRVLFAWCRHYDHLADVQDKTAKRDLPEDSFFHIFEMGIDGSGLRQLTHGRYDDFDARYLPDGRIVFLSTRKGTALQAGKSSAAATTAGLCPDSYVRCGGGTHRPVSVFTLHTMDQDGGDLCAISAFENFEWTPSVAADGRILYARWDYIDRFNGHFFSLWSTNPDGTNSQLVYGNYTKAPQCIFEARPVPGSSKLIFTATAHHSITGGSLALLDRSRGSEHAAPLERLTPEVCFPETEGWPDTYYAHPWPLSEDYYLTAWSDRKLPAHRLMPPDDPNNPVNACGIYLLDRFGNLSLLHRDAEISSGTPIPVRPRPRPPEIPNTIDWAARQQGEFLVQDIYRGLEDIPRGSIHSLRIIGVPPKVQPQKDKPHLGVSTEEPGKFVIGTVPVEADGSAYFRIPSGIPVFFQALDERGLAMQTMRSLTYVQPGQTMACVGCHEQRDTAPVPTQYPLAVARPPSPLRPGPDGTWPLRFDRLVQPVLDRQCVRCHRTGSDDPQAAALDLTATTSYRNLLDFADRDLHQLAFERDLSLVGDMPARRSKLYEMLMSREPHAGVVLTEDERLRLVAWMDTYAQFAGSFSEQQEHELRALRKRFAGLFETP